MAREVVVRVWCDVCQDSEQRTEATEVTLALGRRSNLRALDLCVEHEAQLVEPLRALLAAHGRALDGEAPEEAPEARDKPVQPRKPCPVCNLDGIEAALPSHIFKVHLRRNPPLHKRCPECKWRPPTGTVPAQVARMVGAHRKRLHDRTLINDALEALAASKTLDAADASDHS